MPDTLTPTTDVPVAESMPLRLADRCDRCGAQAFVRIYVGELDLLLCGHDYHVNEVLLAAKGYVVQDERHRINEKPSVSGTPA
jgi:hypothetical protein